MKSIIALAAVLALTGNVEAATSKATTRTAKASKGVRVAAVKKKPSNNTVDAVIDAEAGKIETTESAKLSDVKPLAQAKKWSAAFDTETYAPIKYTNSGSYGANGSEPLQTDFGAKLGYKIADTMTLQGAVEWSEIYSAGEVAEGDTILRDPSIRLSKSDLADLGNGVNLSGQIRYYAPVSDASQDTEQLGLVRIYLTASRELAKGLTASFTLNPRIYMQQNETFINAKGEERGLNTFRLWSFAGVKYAVNDLVAFEQTFGIYQKWRTRSSLDVADGVTGRSDYLDASTSMYLTPLSWMQLQLGIRQSDGATDARIGGLRDLYSQDQTEYFLYSSFSI